MNPLSAASPRKVSRPPTKSPTPLYCPHVDVELDDAVSFDVGDFAELRLMSGLAGEETRLFNLSTVREGLL
ncbi:hypothetical protein [Stigmatella aurantiaca]|uniref:Uncharacterized protein n=1 Tax=Stigmatella aurantiaca (strain DW4/3-1) TaxID=378806 RepID=Q096J3_STIAD|nr:hypothetical protein [Stigmatella aurantiaca]ADO68721.1 uncharacterized protein STAUR_0917 [Stigmatella aurantiaca DW4/3-1]EAU67677.1 hypothetical protein STIAU_0615 [Stigmatella aurantiaca DW4/3-1]